MASKRHAATRTSVARRTTKMRTRRVPRTDATPWVAKNVDTKDVRPVIARPRPRETTDPHREPPSLRPAMTRVSGDAVTGTRTKASATGADKGHAHDIACPKGHELKHMKTRKEEPRAEPPPHVERQKYITSCPDRTRDAAYRVESMQRHASTSRDVPTSAKRKGEGAGALGGISACAQERACPPRSRA